MDEAVALIIESSHLYQLKTLEVGASSLTDMTTVLKQEGRVWQVAAHFPYLASCSSNKTIYIYDLKSLDLIKEIREGHTRSIRSVAWRPVGTPVLASGSFDATIGVWALEDGRWEFLAQLEGHENEIKSVAWSSDGRYLASCSRDKSVWVWEVDEDCEDFECVAVLTEHTQDVKHVCWHPHEELLASASYDDTVRLWRKDDDEWVSVADLKGHDSTVWGCDFSPDTSTCRLVSCSDDLSVRIWKRLAQTGQRDPSALPSTARWESLAEEWEEEHVLPAVHKYPIYAVRWSKYGIASVGADGTLAVYKEDDNGEWVVASTTPQAHGVHEINTVDWYDKVIVTGGDDGTVRFWPGLV